MIYTNCSNTKILTLPTETVPVLSNHTDVLARSIAVTQHSILFTDLFTCFLRLQ